MEDIAIDGWITTQECLELYEKVTGRRIKESTWRSYVARNQVPRPRHVGRTPLWDPVELEAHLRGRPRVGTGGD